MATAKSLKTQLDKLGERIKSRQEELTDLKTKQKDLKSQLAEAKEAEKGKSSKRK